MHRRPLYLSVGMCTRRAARSIVWVKAASQSCTPEPNMTCLLGFMCVHLADPPVEISGACRGVPVPNCCWTDRTCCSVTWIWKKKSFGSSSREIWNSANRVQSFCNAIQDRTDIKLAVHVWINTRTLTVLKMITELSKLLCLLVFYLQTEFFKCLFCSCLL